MNMQPVSVNPSAGPLRFICTNCGRWADQAQATVYADLDGVPFVDYYCAPCATAHIIRGDA